MTGTTDYYLSIWGDFDMKTLGTPPTDLDPCTRQAAWEGAAVARAAHHYHLSAKQADARGGGATTDYGAILMRKLVPGVAERIESLQAEDSKAERSAPVAGAEILTVVEAAPAALITVSETLAACLRDGGPSSVTTVAGRVAAAIRDDMDCRAWLRRRDAPSASRTEDADRRLKDRFLKTYPNPTRRQWLSWSRKVAARTNVEAWTRSQGVAAGSFLIRAAAEAGDVFRVVQGTAKSPTTVELTAAARDELDSIKSRRALSLPTLLPMLTKPLDWAL